MRELFKRLAFALVLLGCMCVFPFAWLITALMDYLDRKLFNLQCDIELAAAARRTGRERKLK